MGKTPEQWHALEKKHRMYVYSAGNQSTEGIQKIQKVLKA